ncbi:MAG: DUF1566 domain-containing protein [Alphaproteobacteria bacterium]|nr:DUF1566 domain-containing protein [Alphaproteobacteria bacterium]
MTDENSRPTPPPMKGWEIGDKKADGTIFAGFVPDADKGFFAMPEDAGKTVAAMLEEYTEMYDLEGNTGLTMDFNKAAKTAEILNKLCAYGHSDWRLPTKEELDVLHKNQDQGFLKGTFNKVSDPSWNTSLYWTSTQSPDNSDENEYQYAYVKDFSGKPVELNCTAHNASVRFVRS